MLRKLRPRSVYDVFAVLALVIAAGGTGAYAADTVFSGDIADNEVYSADVRNDNLSGGGLTSSDLANGSITSGEVRDDTQFPYGLYSQDLAADSVKSSEIADGAVGSSEVQNNSLTGANVADNTLTGADINESTLSLPPTTTATFAFAGPVELTPPFTFAKVASKNVPAGSYAIVATANATYSGSNNLTLDLECQLRDALGGVIGGADDRRETIGATSTKHSLSMNGGAQVPSAGGQLSLWCRFRDPDPGEPPGTQTVTGAQMMIIRLDGFF